MQFSQPQIKAGDIFRWRYRDEKRHSDYLCYWAKSQIAVATEHYINDTFSDFSNPHWTHAQAREDLILTFVANFANLEKKPEYCEEYYADRDIVNLNHSNSSRGNFYIRVGAQRDPGKMLEIIKYKIERAQSEISFNHQIIERLEKSHNRILANEPLDKIYVD